MQPSSSRLPQVARSRAMLSALGIPVWAARAHSSVNAIDDIEFLSIWKQNTLSKKSSQTSVEVQKKQTVAKNGDKHQPPAPQLKPTTPPAPAQNQSTQAVQPINTLQPTPHVEAISSIQFGWQAAIGKGRFKPWILLVATANLNHLAAKQLWDNLLQALQVTAETNEIITIEHLPWPFAESERWQHDNAAPAALAGFLSRLCLENKADKILSLGSLAFTLNYPVQTTVSLAEMLAQPLLKRTLWQTLYKED